MEKNTKTTEEIKKELFENTAMQEYLKNFYDTSVASFIDSFATYKSMWLQYGDMYAEIREDDSIKWVSRASEHLKYIQQKKMFDMQCLWRAEKIEIDGVALCYDFQVWEKDILNCPFLEPITEDDIALYSEYLFSSNSGEEEDHFYYESWQDYDEIVEAYKTDNSNRDFPDWYDFYNNRRGTGSYMSLPNTRGEKEEFYMDLGREYNQKKNETNDPSPAPVIQPEFLSFYDKKQRDWFVKTFETKEVQQQYEAFEWHKDKDDIKEDLESSLATLYSAEEPVIMEAGLNWAEAIKKTATKYTCKKTAEALPEAWEQYMMNIQMNIAFPTVTDKHKTEDYIRNMYKDGILLGRKLNGETEDLNF
jgi:hypothetical protein